MNIWFNTSSGSHDEGDCPNPRDCSDCGDCPDPYDCDDCGDCQDSIDCVSPLRSVQVGQSLIVDEMIALRELPLQHAPGLYIQQHDHERWLVCHPTGSGQIVVLDAQAMSLFLRFAISTTISQLTRQVIYVSQSHMEWMIVFLYRLGFLQNTVRAPLAHKKPSSQTLTAWLHVTNQCNLGCHYCYVHKTPERMRSNIGYKAIDAIFRSALKHRLRHIALKYAGGEASLQMNGVVELHTYAQRLAQEHHIRLSAHILSNGVALSQRTIERLKALQIRVTISLDGLGSDHDRQRPMLNGQGSARYVLRTIDRLLENHMAPYISVTVSQRNLTGLPALMHYLLERNLPFSLNYYRDNDCSMHISDLRFMDTQIIEAMRSTFAVIEKHLPARSLLGSLLDKANLTTPHQHTCGVGQNYLIIDQQGGVSKCQMELQHPIASIDAHDPLQLIREDRRGVQGLAVEEKEGCRSCEWRYWCTGGCPVQTYQSTGRYDIKSPNCNIYKALFPEILRLEALRLLRYTTPLTVGYA